MTGKDRTGLLSMLLLSALGASSEEIFDLIEKSFGNIPQIIWATWGIFHLNEVLDDALNEDS